MTGQVSRVTCDDGMTLGAWPRDLVTPRTTRHRSQMYGVRSDLINATFYAVTNI